MLRIQYSKLDFKMKDFNIDSGELFEIVETPPISFSPFRSIFI